MKFCLVTDDCTLETVVYVCVHYVVEEFLLPMERKPDNTSRSLCQPEVNSDCDPLPSSISSRKRPHSEDADSSSRTSSDRSAYSNLHLIIKAVIKRNVT